MRWVISEKIETKEALANAIMFKEGKIHPNRCLHFMVAEKVRHYQGKNTDLNALKAKIEVYLQNEGFKVQSSAPSPHGIVIQVQKGGFLRDIITADRSFNILIDGEPNNFTVRVGVGKWLKNIAIAAVETLLLTELFLAIDVPEMLWNLEIENKIMKNIDSFIS